MVSRRSIRTGIANFKWGTWGVVSLVFLTLLGTGPAGPQSAASLERNPMDEPLRLLAEARERFSEVHNYTCLFIKRERLDGQLGPSNVMQMRFRKDPFSIGLRWLEPKNLAGQEAYYVTGQNDNKLRVKGSGALGLFGFVTLDLDDARVKASSKHPITQAGIGNLISRYEKGWQQERTWGLSQVNLAEYDYNKRRCWRVEVIHPLEPDDRFLYYRNLVYFDQDSKLPIRVECFDWPEEADDTKGVQAEVVSFAHLKLNVDLEDETFNH